MSRLDKLREKMSELKLDAYIISQRPNQRYISGFSGHADFDALLFITANQAHVATDSRYWEFAQETARGFGLVKVNRHDYYHPAAIADFAKETGARRIGFEADHLPYSDVRDWKKALRKVGAKLQPTNEIIKRMRAVKDETELAAIRRAVQLTDEAFAYFLTQIRPGMTERRAAWVIESYLRERGGQRVAFDIIVASGNNSSLPHAEVTERPIQLGEPITIDMGVMLDHYNSDLTRTISLGEPGAKFREVYNIVLKAQQAVEKKAHAGMKGARVDALARKIIEKAGYGDNFGHGVGHGVGLAVHELPSARKESKDVLEPHMTLTVEPGIYMPGWGGVRIEDLVVIQTDGVQVLSQSTKEPVLEVGG